MTVRDTFRIRAAYYSATRENAVKRRVYWPIINCSTHLFMRHLPGPLKHAQASTSGWKIETVDSSYGCCTSLALDAAGNPHISYRATEIRIPCTLTYRENGLSRHLTASLPGAPHSPSTPATTGVSATATATTTSSSPFRTKEDIRRIRSTLASHS